MYSDLDMLLNTIFVQEEADKITREEAFEIFKKAEKNGLMHQIPNYQMDQEMPLLFVIAVDVLVLH